ncbi:MAG TPA: alpha-glucan family phosphorylase [Streptosporangiaceae bacterium]|nr:alpha-glucan family phosphorylase [Streptosporangiaceae bacterium]
MRAIRRFTVAAALPEPLAPLGELMMNLRWCWHAETLDLFASIDRERWEAVGHDPVRLLGEVRPEQLARLSEDRRFLRRLGHAADDLQEYLEGPRWYQTLGSARDDGPAAEPPAAIAYFSPEFGITAVLPQYSGGLGILAGDHLKTASDLGVPIIGVGLLYRHGYFTQSLSAEGWQQERYPASDPNGLPLSLLRGIDGEPVRVTVPLPSGGSGAAPPETAADDAAHEDIVRGAVFEDEIVRDEIVRDEIGRDEIAPHELVAHVWRAQVGRVPLLLLDSYVEQNEPVLREVTDRLYGGAGEHRLRQELLLGIGGVRAVRAYCALTGHPEPEVFHTNEGHAGFLGLERIREHAAEGLTFDEAVEACRVGTVFTTHTPVAAGIDRFPRELVARHFSGSAAQRGLPADRVLALGAETYPGGDPAMFNMAVMGMRLAQRVNGVSALHGMVSREMFGGLWPGFDSAEVPIGSVTNGVHAPTWVAHDVLEVAEREIGPVLVERAHGWDQVALVPGEEIWAIRRKLRECLVSAARKRLRASWRQRGASEAELTWIDDVLDPDVLTVGFARRVPSYKRLTLMLRDPDRLAGLLLDEERPLQIVIAGKAHPADEGGKKLIQQMVRFADNPRVRHRIVFLPDYDMALGQALVQGCDVWMNNPLRPLEACGTSGMKAALNGGLNLSVKDGWWDEWSDGANGWVIPSAEGVDDPDRRDELEATGLYELLGQHVAPLFYDRDGDAQPRRWIEMVRHTLSSLGPKVLSSRMLHDYVTELYAPAAQASRTLAAPGPDGERYAAARELADWKRRITAAWPDVRIEHAESNDTDLRLGARLMVRATVALGKVSPADVTVELIYGRTSPDDEITEPAYAPLRREGNDGQDGAVFHYSGTVELVRPGPFGYTVRVLPRHRLLASRAELGLVALPAAPPGMTNGDLR